MKKILKLLPLLLVAIIGISFASCSDDKDEPISGTELPDQAQAFIAQYFPGSSIMSSVKDKDEYEVYLADGTRIDFNLSGEWTDVDAATGKTIPSGFYPEGIDTYITTNMSGVGINEISKETNGYEVELVNGTDLLFSLDGVYLGIDK